MQHFPLSSAHTKRRNRHANAARCQRRREPRLQPHRKSDGRLGRRNRRKQPQGEPSCLLSWGVNSQEHPRLWIHIIRKRVVCLWNINTKFETTGGEILNPRNSFICRCQPTSGRCDKICAAVASTPRSGTHCPRHAVDVRHYRPKLVGYYRSVRHRLIPDDGCLMRRHRDGCRYRLGRLWAALFGRVPATRFQPDAHNQSECENVLHDSHPFSWTVPEEGNEWKSPKVTKCLRRTRHRSLKGNNVP